MKAPHHTLFQRCVHCAQEKFIMEYRTDDPKIFQWSCMNCQTFQLNKEYVEFYPDFYKIYDGTKITKIKTTTGPLVYEIFVPGKVRWLLAKKEYKWITLLMLPIRNFTMK